MGTRKNLEIFSKLQWKQADRGWTSPSASSMRSNRRLDWEGCCGDCLCACSESQVGDKNSSIELLQSQLQDSKEPGFSSFASLLGKQK